MSQVLNPRLRFAATGYVFMDRKRAAVRNRPVRNGNNPAIRQFAGAMPRLAVTDRSKQLPDKIFGTFVVDSHRSLSFQNRTERRARLQFRRIDSVNFGVAPVANDEILLAVEHAEPLWHVIDRDAQSLILHIDFFRSGDQISTRLG